MKVAITGGTGFVGRNIARALAEGDSKVIVARGRDETDPTIHQLAHTRFYALGLEEVEELAESFKGCDAVVHCAGINRELGEQTYERVHVTGTRNVVEAARKVGVRRMILLSFLRARPDCGSAYHESKWAAEEIIRRSGLEFTLLKSGVIYGRGDHMLSHLSHAFYTFPFFGLVGFRDRRIRPVAVEDVARIVIAALSGELRNQTVAVLGPEEMSLREAVERVARVAGRRPLMVRLPIRFHYGLAWVLERAMRIPMVSVAQVRMLSEGLAEPAPNCGMVPAAMAPRLAFTEEQIRKGLPAPGGFGLRDLRCRRGAARPHRRRVFFEM